MKTVHKLLLLTITLSVGLSLVGGSVVLWLEGGYGRSPAGVALGASGWLLASILVGRFIPTIDVADMRDECATPVSK